MLSARLIRCFVVVAVCCATGLQLVAQDQPPATFRGGTSLRVVTVTVTDQSGNPIEGLTADDFVVTEDNVPQVVSLLEFERLDETLLTATSAPTFPASSRPTEQTRITPLARGDKRFDDRRLLAFYFDMPSLGDAERFRALEAAMRFLATQMTAADLVAVLTYAEGEVRVRQDFTDDRAALQELLVALMNGDDLDDSSFLFGQSGGEFNLFNTDRQLAALQTAVNLLSVVDGKKALIDFTTGVNLRGADNQAQLRATLNAARRASVAFYPVDARGLVALPPMGDASRRSPGGIGMYTGATAMAMMRGLQRSQDGLYTLAADTGGKALLDYNDLSMGIVAGAARHTELLHPRLLPDEHGQGRTSSPCEGHAEGQGGPARLQRGVLRGQTVREVHRLRQGTPARRSADARRPDHRADDRHGAELLPDQQGRVLRATGGQDSRQRARARAEGRRGPDAHRLHRRDPESSTARSSPTSATRPRSS